MVNDPLLCAGLKNSTSRIRPWEGRGREVEGTEYARKLAEPNQSPYAGVQKGDSYGERGDRKMKHDDLNEYDLETAENYAKRCDKDFLAKEVVVLQGESWSWECKSKHFEEQLNLKTQLVAKDKEIERLQAELVDWEQHGMHRDKANV